MLTVGSIVLIAAAVLPLLLLAVYALASYCGLSIADRLLDATVATLTVGWVIGCIVNIVGGLALVGLGIWAAIVFPAPLVRFAMALLVPFGLWRLWRGVTGLPVGAPPSDPPSTG